MVEEQIRYSDADLAEFKALIQAKLEKAKNDLELIKSAYMNDLNNGTDDTSPTFKAFEEGSDTDSFEIALKNTLRQAPDVILIGEIRSRETMDYAIAFAETGHLVFATLHANNANQAIDRIIHFFEADRHGQLFMDLSLNLKAMVAQQLIPTVDGNSRRAAIEILINSPLISDLIRKGDIHEIKDLMKRSRELGMQTFDQALYDLYKAKQITYKDALKHADSPNDLRLQIKLSEEGADRLMNASSHITLDGQ